MWLTINIKDMKVVLDTMGYFRNNPHLPMDGKLEIQVGGGYRLENSSSGVVFDRYIKD